MFGLPRALVTYAAYFTMVDIEPFLKKTSPYARLTNEATKVNIDGYEIGENKIDDFVKALEDRPLNFFAALSTFSNGEVLYLYPLFSAWPLHRLWLNNNELNDNEIRLLVDAIKDHKTLKILDVENNLFKVEGAIALADMLKTNKVLEELHIARCKIGDQGVVILAQSLKLNNSLSSLDITDCHVNDEGAKAVSDLLDVNDSLKYVAVNSNCGSGGFIDYAIRKEIKQKLEARKK